LVFVLISLSITSSIVPNNISEINNLSVSLFEGMFELSDEIQILPGYYAYFSYNTFSSNVPLM
jgi:hypothetical protein